MRIYAYRESTRVFLVRETKIKRVNMCVLLKSDTLFENLRTHLGTTGRPAQRTHLGSPCTTGKLVMVQLFIKKTVAKDKPLNQVPRLHQKRGVTTMLLKRWRTLCIRYTAKESQIPAHVDSRKKGILWYSASSVGRFQDLILDFSLTHPRYCASKLHPAGQWKLHCLDSVTRSKDNKHAISYEQGHHAYLSLTADTYCKISEDFVRFIWMVATSASTNFRPSQLPPTDTLAPVPRLDEFAVQR